MDPVNKPNVFQSFIKLFKPKESKITEIAIPSIAYVVVNDEGSIKPGRFKLLDHPQTPMNLIRDRVREAPEEPLINSITGNPVISYDLFHDYDKNELYSQMKKDISRLGMTININHNEYQIIYDGNPELAEGIKNFDDMWILNPLNEEGERIEEEQIHLYDLIDPERNVEDLGEKIASCLVQTLPQFMLMNLMEESSQVRGAARLEEYISFSIEGKQLLLDRTCTWSEYEIQDASTMTKNTFYATNTEVNLSQENSIVWEKKLDLPTEIIDFRSIVE